MKTLKYIFIVLLIFPLFSSTCEEEEKAEEEEPQRTTVLLTLNNNSGLTGCNILGPIKVSFIVSYRDIQTDVAIEPNQGAFLNALVEDGESINIRVLRFEDDMLLADANVSVRTTSRPANLEGEPRTISYCRAFNLAFSNF